MRGDVAESKAESKAESEAEGSRGVVVVRVASVVRSGAAGGGGGMGACLVVGDGCGRDAGLRAVREGREGKHASSAGYVAIRTQSA